MRSKRESKAIKVCFVVLKAYPLFNQKVEKVFGGAEVDAYFLATELAKDKNFQVSFVVGDYGQEPVETHQGVTVIKSLDVEKNFFLGGGRLWNALHRADSDIYLRKGASLGTALVAIFCKRHGRNFVCRTAGARECDGTYIKEHRLRGKAFVWSLRQAAAVFTQNDADAKNLSAGVGIDSIAIPNGHRLDDMAPADKDAILWAGRSAEVKRPELFLKLAGEMPQERFIMICKEATDDTRYTQLKEKASLIENLEFISGVPFGQIDSFFQRAKVFVNTSFSEGFANTFIQAGKCSTPILSLKVNPDGFLDKYGCGLCADDDWQRFVDMFKQMLDTEKAEQYGIGGRRYVMENHDVSQIVEQYKDIFRRITANTKSQDQDQDG
ncbi:MAG: glycosyltransferase family 4 protein [Planctomycetota bacterium]